MADDLLTLTRDSDVWVLTMTKADNRFNPRWASAFSAALDRVEAVAARPRSTDDVPMRARTMDDLQADVSTYDATTSAFSHGR